MSEAVPAPIRRILEEGAFCHVATLTPKGPHLTPMVFASAAERVWVTTSRGSVKARAWRRDPAVAGLVRSGDRAAAFTGTVTTYDLLETGTWGRSVARGPLLALAGFRFTQKNARFFAGYAVDAHQVPLAWSPPGRVFAEIRLERTATLQSGIGARRSRASNASAPIGSARRRWRACPRGSGTAWVRAGRAPSRSARARDRSCSRCGG